MIRLGPIPSSIHLLGYEVPITWTDRTDIQGESSGWDEDRPRIELSAALKSRSVAYQHQVLVHEAYHIVIGLMGLDEFLTEPQAELVCRVAEQVWRGLAGGDPPAKASKDPG